MSSHCVSCRRWALLVIQCSFDNRRHLLQTVGSDCQTADLTPDTGKGIVINYKTFFAKRENIKKMYLPENIVTGF